MREKTFLYFVKPNSSTFLHTHKHTNTYIQYKDIQWVCTLLSNKSPYVLPLPSLLPTLFTISHVEMSIHNNNNKNKSNSYAELQRTIQKKIQKPNETHLKIHIFSQFRWSMALNGKINRIAQRNPNYVYYVIGTKGVFNNITFQKMHIEIRICFFFYIVSDSSYV